MRKLKLITQRVLSAGEEVSSIVAQVAVGMILVLVVVEISCRFLLGFSVQGVYETMACLGVLVFILPLALAERLERGISISVIAERVGETNRLKLKVLSLICGLIYYGAFFIWVGIPEIIASHQTGQIFGVGMGLGRQPIPSFILKAILTMGGLLVWCELTRKLVVTLRTKG